MRTSNLLPEECKAEIREIPGKERRQCILCGKPSAGEYPHPGGQKYYEGKAEPPLYVELCGHHASHVSGYSVERMLRRRMRLTDSRGSG